MNWINFRFKIFVNKTKKNQKKKRKLKINEVYEKLKLFEYN
jgi:hypothetical protein